MTLYGVLTSLLAAGMSGGFINAILVDRGLILPKIDRLPDQTILRLGFVGNMIVGGFAALMIGGLYGPLSAVEISGPLVAMHLSFSSLAAGILTGAGGARVFSQEIEKRYTRASQKNLAKTLKRTIGSSDVE